MGLCQKCYPDLKWLETVEAQEDPNLAFSQAQTLINKYGAASTACSACPAWRPRARRTRCSRPSLCGKVAVIGLATPNQMRPFVDSGCVKSVVLWNPVDLGYAAVYVMRAVVDGDVEARRHLGHGRQARRPEGRQWQRNPAWPTLRLHPDNINDFDF